MPDRSESVEHAFRNRTAVARYIDYRGIQVISAYGPIEVAGLRWAISAKQDVTEALATAIQLKRDLLVAAAAATIALTFLALICAGLFMRPLRRVVAGRKAFSDGASASRIKIRGSDDFAELAHGYYPRHSGDPQSAGRSLALPQCRLRAANLYRTSLKCLRPSRTTDQAIR
jgi:hypothetical protein